MRTMLAAYALRHARAIGGSNNGGHSRLSRGLARFFQLHSSETTNHSAPAAPGIDSTLPSGPSAGSRPYSSNGPPGQRIGGTLPQTPYLAGGHALRDYEPHDWRC